MSEAHVERGGSGGRSAPGLRTTLLVCNRGEIAIRVFRTAKRMGMRTVAVYSAADENAPHVRAADVGYRIGEAPAMDSYLRRDRIIGAARETGAELVHPGYGFLAEDDRFAQDCEDNGLVFVGPPSHVLRAVGDKFASRALAVEAGVPVLAGYAGDDQSDRALARAAEHIGYPVIVKPAAGGGGKGMSVVLGAEDLTAALASARRVALTAFGDDRLLLERYVEHPRHVEVQVFGDTHGNVVHLGERDCSLQRRHQKVLEESPAPDVDADVGSRLHRAAVDFARHARYVGAGTCEFLLATDGALGFIEMNARLQVEHPVTEMVTGLDLVELQLRVALGEALPFGQDGVRSDGHAIEVRVYAEDPEGDFLPQAGRVEHVRWPDIARTDTGIDEGTEVSPHYDPLLAKVIVRGEDRSAALAAIDEALRNTEVLGVRTNITFLRDVVRDPVVIGAKVSTDWLEQAYADWRPVRDEDLAIAIAAAAETDRILHSSRSNDPWTTLGPWRGGGASSTRVVLRTSDGERSVTVDGRGPFTVAPLTIERAEPCHAWLVTAPHRLEVAAARDADRWFVWARGVAYEIDVGIGPRRLAVTGPARLDSPLPGQVVAVHVHAGQEVSAGDELVIVEAMKMEHAITAPAAGVVRAVLCAEGDQVERGQPLVDFEPD